jgi:hypothetical protein
VRLRRLIVLASGALALALLAPTAALAGSGPHARVVRGTSSSTSTLNANTLTGSNAGTVHLDHIGTFTTAGTIASFSFTSTSFNSSGTTTYTTKKGATLFGTFETSATLTGTAPGDTGTFTTVTTITGGTRRFAHASGELTTVGTSVIVSDVDNVVTTNQTAKITGTLRF